MFRLQILSDATGEELFLSSPFLLNARKKPCQDQFWKEIRLGKRKRDDSVVDEGDGQEQPQENELSMQNMNSSEPPLKKISMMDSMNAFPGDFHESLGSMNQHERAQFQEPIFEHGGGSDDCTSAEYQAVADM